MTAADAVPERFTSPAAAMRHAIALAARGRGHVEPNPMVGSVLVDDGLRKIADGWHARFGGPHAEVEALVAAGTQARGQTLYVTLEPCCHTGKTGPCTKAILAAGVRKVVIGVVDPAPHVAGGGIAELRAAGVQVEVGLLEEECRALAAPFFRRVTDGLPWVHAKWAMTLDGKIASRTGASQWISNERSRTRVHQLRGLMDGIVVGAGTVRADDPLLTARPPGLRTATRIVFDSHASLPLTSQLVRTVSEAPVLLVCRDDSPAEKRKTLQAAGVQVLAIASHDGDEAGRTCERQDGRVPLRCALRELSRRGMTHLLVEGGSQLLGSLLDQCLIDEVHVFVAPKLVGGRDAPPPISGIGAAAIPQRSSLETVQVEILDEDVYITGRVRR